jgi:uncharacterized protein YegL
MEQARNNDQKCPVVLLLDTSGSMEGAPIDELNSALTKLKEDILCDPLLLNRLEIGIVAFDDEGRIERPIDLISAESSFPVLTIGGRTNLVSGMNIAMSMVEERRTFYKANNELSYRPIIVLITDGAPTNTEDEINALDAEIQSKSDNKKFLFMPFGTVGADTNLLAKLAAQTADERLKRVGKAYLIKDVSQFSKVFEFVSASVGAAMNQGGTADVILSPEVAQQVTVPIDLS